VRTPGDPAPGRTQPSSTAAAAPACQPEGRSICFSWTGRGTIDTDASPASNVHARRFGAVVRGGPAVLPCCRDRQRTWGRRPCSSPSPASPGWAHHPPGDSGPRPGGRGTHPPSAPAAESSFHSRKKSVSREEWVTARDLSSRPREGIAVLISGSDQGLAPVMTTLVNSR
jgi:hypothetical protein